MIYKWIGAILVIFGCGSCGFAMASRCRFEEKLLLNLSCTIEYMENELQYSLTQLPDLCRKVAKNTTGILRRLFQDLSCELDWQVLPDVKSCMVSAVQKNPDLPRSVRNILLQMGRTLGEFDLTGQMKELESLRARCERELKRIDANSDSRIKNYKALGLCSGVALAILFA